MARSEGIGAVRDVGLHGGSVQPRGGSELELNGDQLVPGVAVTGTVHVGPGLVTAQLSVVGPSLSLIHI